MQLTPEDLEEFKKIYKEEFEEDLSDAEVVEIAERLVRLYALLAEPLPEELKELGLDEMPDLSGF